MFRKLLATTLILTAASCTPAPALARTAETCLNGVAVTNYGVAAPSSLRQCFGYKYPHAELETMLVSLGYRLTASGINTHIYYDGSTWLFVNLDRYGKVSEIMMVMDKPL